MIVNEIKFAMRDNDDEHIVLTLSTFNPEGENIGGLTMICKISDDYGNEKEVTAFLSREEKSSMSNQLRLMADFIYGNP
jgi:hypothetical protein